MSSASDRAPLILVGVLLLATLALPVTFMRDKSVTGDEIAHLPAGFSYLLTRRILLNPMHPPLVKELCALPLLFLDARMPADASTISEQSTNLAYQWQFGRAFFSQPGRDQLLFWSRVPAVLLSVGLALLVFRWASELWGRSAGALSLFLYAFDPTITAHAQLVTTDVGVAFFSTLYLYVLRHHLRGPRLRSLLVAGVCLGLALGAKFSALLLLPLTALLLAAAAWSDGERPVPPRPGRMAAAAISFVVLLGIAYVVLWIIYFGPADPLFYWNGLKTVRQDIAVDYPVFLMGQFHPGGSWLYFPIAWVIKTPLPSLLLLGLAAALFLAGTRRNWREELFILAPALGFFAGYSALAAQLGIRYLIPCSPFFCIFTARVAASSRRVLSLAAGLLLAWHAAEFVAIAPDHLSYFNEIAGGSSGGIDWLDDSNVDWGQGFLEVDRYVRARPVGPYSICYLPSILDPASYGLEGKGIRIDALLSRPPGYLILSAHCIARAKAILTRKFGDGPANWLTHEEPTGVVGHAFYVYASES